MDDFLAPPTRRELVWTLLGAAAVLVAVKLAAPFVGL